MTRLSKIARLPHAIREELNGRLLDGEFGQDLAAWLNSLPDVQRILADHFDSRPINEQNLSDWRYAGYEDWQRRQATSEWMTRQIDETAELTNDLPDHSVTGQLVAPLAATLGRLVHRAAEDALRDPEQQKTFLALARELSHLRRDDQNEQRINLLRERLALAMEDGYGLTKSAYAERLNRIEALRAFARKTPRRPEDPKSPVKSPPKSPVNSQPKSTAEPPARSAIESAPEPAIESPAHSADEPDDKLPVVTRTLESITESLLASLARIKAADDPGNMDPKVLDPDLELLESESPDSPDDLDSPDDPLPPGLDPADPA